MDELRKWATEFGTKTAWQLFGAVGERVDYATLDANATRAALLLLEDGLAPGDTIALMLPNGSILLELMWAARRLGLYFTPISTKLTNQEASYILRDCGARAFFDNGGAADIEFDGVRYDINIASDRDDRRAYLPHRNRQLNGAALPVAPIGKDFVYSSGTTGRPKGVRRELKKDLAAEEALSDWIQNFSRHGPTSICLLSAPLYHAAPLRFAMRSISQGGTVIALPRFDAESALKAIQEFKITHSLWVPTMFYRLLALPKAVRDLYDLSSLQLALHSGGPCSADIKRRMIEWWGPVVWEYYAASEGNGATCISPEDALSHPGSVGLAVMGKVHIVGPDGNDLPPGADGDIYFEGGPRFEYHNDPAKTAAVRHAQGWTTVGDVGHLDPDGFLYLTDRKAHTVISGGVNIYPAEIEDVLRAHPAVADAAVFGIPNAEFGEEVKAVVELHGGCVPDEAMTADLLMHCRKHLSSIKCPRSVSFEAQLPRSDSGKLPKGDLKRRYSMANH